MLAWHIGFGSRGEKAAARYLRENGYEVLERNWRCKVGELDLICVKGDTIIFVEVKTRSQSAMADPLGAVDTPKRRKLSRAAAEYLTTHDAWDSPCRFDVVAIVIPEKGAKPQIVHIENAFELSLADAGGWQPW